MKNKLSLYNAITVLLIICTIPLGEINQFLPHYKDAAAYHLFPFNREPMQFAWYYVFVIRAVTWVLVMLAVVRIAANQSSHFVYLACKVYLFYRVCDLLTFLLCRSSSEYYPIVYITVALYAINQYVQYFKNEKTINGR